LIKNSQPFAKKFQKTVGGVFLTHSVYAIAHRSVRLCVRPSHGWISQKQLKLGLWHFHLTVVPSP